MILTKKQKMRYLFFDTETTGLPFKNTEKNGHTHSSNGYPRPVQIGWETDEPETGMIKVIMGYVKPEDFVMPKEVSDFNGITQGMLVQKGISEKLLLDSFMSDVKDSEALVGHNIAFDITVIVGRLHDLGRFDDAALLLNKPPTARLPVKKRSGCTESSCFSED